MSAELRDAFQDLVTEVPRHVVPPDLAGLAWSRGRRRRWQKRVVGSALAVALAGLMTMSLAPLADELRTPPPAEPARGVTDFPQAIGYQWWVRDLPDRPGPMAALVEIKDPPGRFGVSVGTRQDPVEWHVVSPRGHRWRLPMQLRGAAPTISPDGRYLGYHADNGGPYVIHDLVTGDKVQPPELGSVGEPHRHGLVGEHPAFWSPDGRSALLRVSSSSANRLLRWLRVGVDGSTRLVHPEGGDGQWLGHLAGWVDNSAVLVLGWRTDSAAPPGSLVTEVMAHTVTLDGEVRRTLQLEPAIPWRGDRFDQWSGVVSPDGSRLLLLEQDYEGNRLVRVFSLSDGAEVGEPVWDGADAPICPATWTDTAPAVPDYRHGKYATTFETRVPVAVAPPDEPDRQWLQGVVAVAPGLGVQCIIWAADAVAQAPKDGPLSLHSDAWWAWSWQELHYTWFGWLWREAVTLLALLVASIAALRWWSRRRATAITSRSPG